MREGFRVWGGGGSVSGFGFRAIGVLYVMNLEPPSLIPDSGTEADEPLPLVIFTHIYIYMYIYIYIYMYVCVSIYLSFS